MAEIINKTKDIMYDANDNEIVNYYETSADQVIADDGRTLEEKVGAIDGITGSLTSTSESMAASANGLKTVNDSLVVNSDHFYFDYQNGKYGYNTSPERGADTFHPFRGAYTLTQIPTCNRPHYATAYPLEVINNGIILDVKDYSSLRITGMGGTAWAIQGITSGGSTATLANGVNAYYTPATYDITNYDTIKIVSYATDASAPNAQLMSGILS